MELKTLSFVLEQSLAIALFIALLYVIQAVVRSSRYLENKNQVRIDIAHRIRSGAFQRSVNYLRANKKVPTGGGIREAGFQEPEDVQMRLLIETEWKRHPEVNDTQVQHRSGGSSRIAG